MKKLSVVREVEVVVYYSHLYTQTDDAGVETPIEFVYPCTVQRKADADIAESEAKLGGKNKLSAAQKLSRLLTGNPRGFESFEDPFPMDDRPLAERALEYFSKPGMEDFAEDALLARANAIYPAQLFR